MYQTVELNGPCFVLLMKQNSRSYCTVLASLLLVDGYVFPYFLVPLWNEKQGKRKVLHLMRLWTRFEGNFSISQSYNFQPFFCNINGSKVTKFSITISYCNSIEVLSEIVQAFTKVNLIAGLILCDNRKCFWPSRGLRGVEQRP